MKKLAAIMLCLTLLINMLPISAYAAEDIEGHELLLKNGSLSFYMDKATGNFIVKNNASGYLWRSQPLGYENDPKAQGLNRVMLASQIAIKFIDRLNAMTMLTSAASCVKNGGLTVEVQGDSVLCTYTFAKEGITVPLRYSISDNFLNVAIEKDKVVDKGEKYTLSGIVLLPLLGAGGTDEDGYIFVPDGSGALINFNNNKTSAEYSQYIYGRDAAITLEYKTYYTQEALLPVFGIAKGSEVMTAVITKGDSKAIVNASVSGYKHSYNSANVEFIARETGSLEISGKSNAPVTVRIREHTEDSLEDYEVRYYFDSTDKSGYVRMAENYREFLIDEKGFTKTVESGNYPLFVNLYGSIEKPKSHFGLIWDTIIPLTTYRDARDIIDEIRVGGAKSLAVQYTSWNKGGMQTTIDNMKSFSPEGALGGGKDFKELAKYTKSEGIPFFPEVDAVNMYKESLFYNKMFSGAVSLNNLVSEQYTYIRSTYESHWQYEPYALLTPKKAAAAANESVAKAVKAGADGIALSTMGSRLYSDFSKSENYHSRQNTINAFDEVFAKVNQSGLLLMASMPNGYALPYTNYLAGLPSISSKFTMTDYDVPFYQIAVQGFKYHSTQDVNAFTDTRDAILTAAETGASLQYSFAKRNIPELKQSRYDYLSYLNYDEWKTHAIDSYKKLSGTLTNLSDKAITNHTTIAKGITVTEYTDGTRIAVNKTKTGYTYNGKVIPAMDYLVLGGEGR